MLRALLVRYFRLFLSPPAVLWQVLPLGALSVALLLTALPTALAALAGAIGLLWAMHLHAEMHDDLLPNNALLDALAYRGQYAFMWGWLMALLGGACLLYMDGATLRMTLVVGFLFLSGHFALRCHEVANHAQDHLTNGTPIAPAALELRPRWMRWLVNGKTMDFPWNKRK